MDTELLMLLKNKFGNSRIVRKIYKFVPNSRLFWLRKYRKTICSGYNVRLVRRRMKYTGGVKTYVLTGKNPEQKALSHRKNYRKSGELIYLLMYPYANKKFTLPELMGRRTDRAIIKNCKDNGVYSNGDSRQQCIAKLMKL